MALNFHARLTADGKQAQVEIRGTAEELEKLAARLNGVKAEGGGASNTLAAIERRARAATVSSGICW